MAIVQNVQVETMLMSELFTKLSDQQQEVVAGGAITTLNLNATSFNSDTELLSSASAVASGPGGSVSLGVIDAANQEISTSALNRHLGAVD